MLSCRVLPEKFVEKAKRELREDENRKEQALEHFREWLKKHPYIKEYRQGILNDKFNDLRMEFIIFIFISFFR